jgi:hypothetical protein
MRKYPEYIMQMLVPQAIWISALDSLRVVSTPLLIKKYLLDKINEATSCILLYVKGRTLWTIKVVDTIVMSGHIIHGWLILLECAVVKVTTIREGNELEDPDYPNEDKTIGKLKDAKGNFIL